ncbi:MAG: NlpC/P60 family protein [Candidatus Paceibacterota bacterium]
MNANELVDRAICYLEYPAVKYTDPSKGSDKSGFDCSGFVLFLLRELNFPVPQEIRHVNEFYNSFGIHIHDEARMSGDLIFWSRKGTIPTHIGILVNDTYYIHSPGKTGRFVSIEEIKYEPIISKAEPKIYFKNPIGFKRLGVKDGRYLRLI